MKKKAKDSKESIVDLSAVWTAISRLVTEGKKLAGIQKTMAEAWLEGFKAFCKASGLKQKDKASRANYNATIREKVCKGLSWTPDTFKARVSEYARAAALLPKTKGKGKTKGSKGSKGNGNEGGDAAVVATTLMSLSAVTLREVFVLAYEADFVRIDDAITAAFEVYQNAKSSKGKGKTKKAA